MRPENFQGIRNRRFRGLARDEGRVLEHPEQHDGYPYIEHRAHHQRSDDAKRQVTLRLLAFLGRGRDGIKTDIGKEHDGAAGQDTRES